MSQLPSDGIDSWESSAALEAARFRKQLDESRRENSRLQAELAAYEARPARALRLLQTDEATATHEVPADDHAAAQDQEARVDTEGERPRVPAAPAAYEARPTRAVRLLQTGGGTATHEERVDDHAAAPDRQAQADTPAEANEKSHRERARLPATPAPYEATPARAVRLLQTGEAAATREKHVDDHAAAQDQEAHADLPAEAYSMSYYLDKDCSSRSSNRHYAIKPAAFPGCFNIERKGSITASFQLICSRSNQEVLRHVHHKRDCSGPVSRVQRTEWGIFEGGCHQGKRLVPPLRAEDYPACKMGRQEPAEEAPRPAGQSMLEVKRTVLSALHPRDGFLTKTAE